MDLNDSIEIQKMEVDDHPKEAMETTNGLNSSFDNLTNYDYLSSSDRTRVNLQKFESAEDKSSALDDESHRENCNVYRWFYSKVALEIFTARDCTGYLELFQKS
eukprot:26523_1